MRRLSGQDASFLYVESSTLFMHTIKLLVFDPSASSGRPEALLELVASRLSGFAAFRSRLVEVPLRLHHPVWRVEPSLRVAAHLRRVTLPAPGGQAELDAAVAEIAASRLDRDKPLWELALLEGLEGGRVALVLKLHHAVADGIAAMRLIEGAFAADQGGVTGDLDASAEEASSIGLLAGALADHLRQVGALPGLVAATSKSLARLVRSDRTAVHTPTPVLDAPRTSLNRPLSPRRSFASCTLSVDAIHAVKQAFGVSFNDVALAVAAGALRRYLEQRGELPARSLIASVPVSREGGASGPRLGGNRLSNLFATLATDVADPVERLRAIHAVADVAKAQSRILDVDLVTAWSNYVPPVFLGLEKALWGRPPIGGRIPPPINVVVSNVQGPHERLSALGWRVSAVHSAGPVLEGIGVNITLWSYLDGAHVGVLACREMVPEPSRITAAMVAALDELRALVQS